MKKHFLLGSDLIYLYVTGIYMGTRIKNYLSESIQLMNSLQCLRQKSRSYLLTSFNHIWSALFCIAPESEKWGL